MRPQNRHTSIYLKLFRLLLLSALISGGLFLAMYYTGNALMDHYFDTSDYIDRKNEEQYTSLQHYIDDRNISSSQVDELSKWVKKQKVVSLQIFKGNSLIYDSYYPNAEEVEITSEDYYGWEEYYTITFADGEADAFLYGMYTYQFYNYALFGELLVSFALFILIVLLGIQKYMKYIQKLKKEIDILEGGNLGYEITVMGSDELAELAQSLDEMRQSLKEQIEQENELTAANQKMITEMSHDLRTPLTSLLLYTEILQKHKFTSQEQLMKYIRKIEDKAFQMKQLSDDIFEYSLAGKNEKTNLIEPVQFSATFYDVLSEMTDFLNDKGFGTTVHVDWEATCILINYDYISRIINNITSNIVKYANPNQNVCINTQPDPKYIVLSFENAKKTSSGKKDSTHIGIRNVKKMMEELQGFCQVAETNSHYSLTLYFAKTEK